MHSDFRGLDGVSVYVRANREKSQLHSESADPAIEQSGRKGST